MTMEEKEVKLTYPIAKNHQIIQLSPIFRPIRRGARKKGIERVYISKDNKIKAKIKMFRELDIADQDLLLTILAIALPIDRGIIIDKKSNNYQILLEKLKIKNTNHTSIQTLMIETTTYELLNELGKTAKGKNNYKWLNESLERLSDTNLYLETKDFIGNTNLISFYMEKNKHTRANKIYIALNPLNALVLLNDKKGYILNNRKERLLLKSDVAKALHAILLTLLDNKQTKIFKLTTLIEKVYSEKYDNLNTNQKKNYKRTIKKALEEIKNTLKNTFTIEIFDNNTVKINRSF